MSGELTSMVSLLLPGECGGLLFRELWRLLGWRPGEGLRRLSPGLLLGGRDLDRLLNFGLAVASAGA